METSVIENLPKVQVPPGTEELVKQSNSTLQLAQYMTVDSQDTYETACESIIEFKDTIKAREAFFKPAKQALDAAKKIILDWEKAAVNPLQRAIILIEGRALTWRRAEEKKAAVERRRLEAEERQKEEDRRMEQAAQLEKDGHGDAAEALIAQPIEQMVIPMEPAVQKVDGLSTQKRFDFEITDPDAINRAYMTPDLVTIRKQVNALGFKAVSLVGGIRVFEKESFTRRR
jgi:hypothetical protein